MELILYPNKILEQKTLKVKKPIDNTIIEDMINILEEKGGIGLSANQVGINKKFFIAFDNLFINPKIIKNGGSKVKKEGCLSIPSYQIPVKRFTKITIEYQDNGMNKETIQLKGLKARIVQHEIDHLNGITILDRGVNKYKCRHFKKMLKTKEK